MRLFVNPVHHYPGKQSFLRKIFGVPKTLVVRGLKVFGAVWRGAKFSDIRFFGLLTLTIFLSVLFVSSAVKLFQKKRETGLTMGELKEKIAKLRRENKEMEEILNQAATPSFIEKEVRRKLNMKKPGEKMVIIVPPKQDENQELGIKNQEVDEEPISFFGKIKRLFFP